MSADTTIVILITKGPEFRVTEAMAIENIEYQPDYPPEKPVYNRQALLDYFGRCQIYRTQLEVYQEAIRLEQKNGPTEYGIMEFVGTESLPFPRPLKG